MKRSDAGRPPAPRLCISVLREAPRAPGAWSGLREIPTGVADVGLRGRIESVHQPDLALAAGLPQDVRLVSAVEISRAGNEVPRERSPLRNRSSIA